MKNIISMSFVNYSMNQLNYVQNNNFNQELLREKNPKLNGSIAFDSNVFYSKKKPQNGLVSIKIQVGSLNAKNSPFQISLESTGYFSFNLSKNYKDDLDPTIEEIKNLLATNGNAILYPYIRSIIWDISSKSNVFPPYKLPTMNFVAELQKKDRIHFKEVKDE